MELNAEAVDADCILLLPGLLRLGNHGPKYVFGNKGCTLRQTQGRIHRQDCNRGSPEGSSPDQDWAVPTEMTRPLMAARVEKPVLLPVRGSTPARLVPL